MKLLILLFILLLISPTNIYGQKSVELISIENSALPENDIWSLAIDSTGNKWFGSAKSGLVKYDNLNYKIYNSENSIIKGGHLGPLFIDNKEVLWISASKPDELFVYKNDSLEKITNKEINELDGIIAIAQNSKGELFFGGKNGIIKFDGKNWKRVELPKENIIVRTIDISENNTVAIGHNEGLIIGKESTWKNYYESKDELQLSVVRGLKFVNDSTLIIGYGGGFGNGGFSIKKGEEWKHFNRSNSKISDHMVRDIEVDEDGVYWMATNNGLMKFNGVEIEPIFFREGMFKNTIFDVSVNNNTIWIATNFGVIKLKK